MSENDFAVRLQPSLFEAARTYAAAEGIALDTFVNAAVSEKITTLATHAYYRERAARANLPEALKILERVGIDGPPLPGDER